MDALLKSTYVDTTLMADLFLFMDVYYYIWTLSTNVCTYLVNTQKYFLSTFKDNGRGQDFDYFDI